MPESDIAVRVEPAGPERHDVPLDGRSGFVRVADRQVHYLEWGPADGPPVLAMHGGGQTSYMFEETGAALRDRYHVIAPDLPHHGESDPLADPERFGRIALAETVPPLLDEFGVQQAAIIGASLGGIVGLTLAARWPERVRAIVLIDVGHRLEESGVRRIIDFLGRHESFGSLDEAAAAIAEYLPHRKRTDPERLRRNLRQRADGRWVWKHGLGRASNQLTSQATDWQDILAGLGEDVARVHAPVLVLRGARSDVLSSAGAEEVAELLPNAEVVEVGDAGHLAAGDNPTSTIDLVRRFLDGLDDPG
ncbi:MAG TPA: alpha/beta hydrolase [Mycobacteriales bacterium]|nr:alpha/beta hydrolase [Mycobacteriales bacterium]